MALRPASEAGRESPRAGESGTHTSSEGCTGPSGVQCRYDSNLGTSADSDGVVEGTEAASEGGAQGHEVPGPRFSMPLAVKAESFLNFVVAKLTTKMLKFVYTAVLALIYAIFKFISLAFSKIF